MASVFRTSPVLGPFMVHRIPRRVGGTADHLMSSCLFFKAICIPLMRVQVFLLKTKETRIPKQKLPNSGRANSEHCMGREEEGGRVRGANVHHVRANCAVVRVGCDRPMDASCTQGVVPIEPSCRGRAGEALFFETRTSDNPPNTRGLHNWEGRGWVSTKRERSFPPKWQRSRARFVLTRLTCAL